MLELTDCKTVYTLSISWSTVLSPIYLLSNCNAVITDRKIFWVKTSHILNSNILSLKGPAM